MKCERCGSDTSVRKHSVDGYSGYVCEDCLCAWARLVDAGAIP